MAHTVYNNTGQPLFSVDRNGIYYPNGTQAYDFTVGEYKTIKGVGVDGREAVSEICTFPCRVAADNHSYYAMFWAKEVYSSHTNPSGPPTVGVVMRVVRVDVAGSGALSFTNNILYDDNAYAPKGLIRKETKNTSTLTIAADEQHCNASHDIYTTEVSSYSNPFTFDTYGLTMLRKWTFGADGSLPVPTTPTYVMIQYATGGLQKAKIIHYNNRKYYAFASYDIPSFAIDGTCNKLVCWDITEAQLPLTADISSQWANVAVYHTEENSHIAGFEVVGGETPGDDKILVSRFVLGASGGVDIPNSGLVYFDEVPRGNDNSTFTIIANTSDFGYTDLERSKQGNIYMVKGINHPSVTHGELAYIYGSGVTATSSPTVVSNTCGSSIFVSARTDGPTDGPTPFYLGKQFGNEGLIYPEIRDISISNRCAPGSPGATAPNPQYFVTTNEDLNPYTYLWTPKPPLFSFPYTTVINNAHLDHDNIPNPTITSVSDVRAHGAAPTITAYFTLTVTNSDGCTISKEVKTDLITSGYDLASRDSHFDLFNEANTQDINLEDWDIWSSPDIFNRYHDDGTAHPFEHEIPNFATTGGTDNFLFVNVRNVGCVDYDPATVIHTAKLHTYWTMGGFSAETWPYAWDGTGQTPVLCNGTQQPLGSELTTSPGDIPFIAAGGSAFVGTQWTPRDPTLYNPSCAGSDPNMELCFLSRITDNHNPSCVDGMTICELTTGTESANVKNNNNIATRNTSIAKVTSLPAVRHHILTAGNGGLTDANFNIEMANGHVLHNTGISTLSK